MVNVSGLREKATHKAPQALDALLDQTPVSAMNSCTLFPWSVPCDKGNYNDEGWHAEIGALEQHCKAVLGYGYRLVYGQARNTRWQGQVPNLEQIVFDTAEDLFRFIAKYDEATFLLTVADNAAKTLSGLKIPLVSQKPWVQWLKANKTVIMNNRSGDFWKGVLDLAAYLAANPDSGLFPRELPVSVDTKFLESNCMLVMSLVNSLRPDIPILSDKSLTWPHRLGLRTKEDMIHLRLPVHADLMVQNTMCSRMNLIIIPKEAFISFSYPSVRRVFIIENETLFLTFPLSDGELAIYKGGFAITALAGAQWLSFCDLFYFSDIDEHGFAMLDIMREMYPGTKNFCMDEQTYKHFSEYRVQGKAFTGDYERLTDSEIATLKRIKADIGYGRLEQEHIDLGYIEQRKRDL